MTIRNRRFTRLVSSRVGAAAIEGRERGPAGHTMNIDGQFQHRLLRSSFDTYAGPSQLESSAGIVQHNSVGPTKCSPLYRLAKYSWRGSGRGSRSHRTTRGLVITERSWRIPKWTD